jgi:hypothetical protein
MLNKNFNYCIASFANFFQCADNRKVTIKAGEDISEIHSTTRFNICFPIFNTTEVKLKDGGTTRAKMNFNVYMNEIQFIDNIRGYYLL